MTLVVRLTPELEDGLERLAARAGQSAEAVAAQALERFVSDELEIVRQIERGLDDLRNGRVVPHEQVTADIERLLGGGSKPER